MALQSGNYVLDAQHSTVGFTVRHAMITKVHGQFTEFESVINFDADKPENSTAKATIQASSINTFPPLSSSRAKKRPPLPAT